MEKDRAYVKTSSTSGRGLFAKNDIRAGEQIFSIERPMAAVLDSARCGDCCSNCFSWTSSPVASYEIWGHARRPELKACSQCKILKFCNRTCQAEAWKKFHKFECKSFSRIPQGNELPSAVRAAIQIVNMRTHGVLSNVEWEEFQGTTSHIDDIHACGKSRWSDFVLMSMGILHYSSAKETSTLEDVQQIFARILSNSLTLIASTFDPLGLVLDPFVACANHSCEPNAFIVMDNQHLSMRSLKAIAKDAEIFISYIDTTYPFSRRQTELKERFFFDCKCTKCLQGSTLNEDRWAGDPREMPKDWKRYCQVIRDTDPKFAKDLQEEDLDEIDDSDKAMSIIQDWAFHALKTIHDKEFASSAKMAANVERIMDVLAQTERCPVYRQPYPSARHELVQSYSHSANFFLAWSHGAKTYFYVDPLLYPQTHHPLRVVHNANLAMLTLVVSTDLSWREHPETREIDFGVLVYYLFLEVVANIEKSHGKDNSFAKLLKRKFDQLTTDMTRADRNAVMNLERRRDGTWRQFRKFADDVYP